MTKPRRSGKGVEIQRLHFFERRISTEGEADKRMSEIGGNAHGEKDVGWVERTRGTLTAGKPRRNAFKIEGGEKRKTVATGDGEGNRVGKAGNQRSTGNDAPIRRLTARDGTKEKECRGRENWRGTNRFKGGNKIRRLPPGSRFRPSSFS